MPGDSYTGEFFDFTIATEDALSPIGYTGEYAESYFATPIEFDPIGYAGEYGWGDLLRVEPITFSGTAYSGQYSTLGTINFASVLVPRAFTGSEATVEFAPVVLIDFQPRAYTGQNGVVDTLFFTFSLGPILGYTGEYGSITGMESTDIDRFYTGENIFGVLATTDVLRPIGSGGEVSAASLFVGAPGVFDAFRAYTGTRMLVSLERVHTPLFYILIRNDTHTQCDIDSATYFDLASDDCCGPRKKSNNLRMNLSRTDYLPEAVSYGNDVRLYVDLSCAVRFSGTAHNGEVGSFYNKAETFSVIFEDGCEMNIAEFEADETHRLCRGYFIPDGNWVVTELNDILLDTCYADQFVEGQTMDAVLSANPTIILNEIGSGETMIPTLIVNPPWEIIFYTEERLYFNLALESRLELRAYSGEVLRPSLWFPPIRAYAGETVEVIIVDDLHVRFLEDGCLDNQFRFQNASGDEIPELYNPVPVEGEPYYHVIGAECHIGGE